MYEPHLISTQITYFLAVWFFILIAIGKDVISKSKSSIILFLSYLIYSFIMFFITVDNYTYIEEKSVFILIDIAAGLSMVIILGSDKKAWKHALILCFAVLCHSMILLSLKIQTETFFYTWYDEFIILVCLLQLSVTFDDMAKNINNAFRRVQVLLCGFGFCHIRGADGSPTHKSRKTKA